jgi:hypothetical protein
MKKYFFITVLAVLFAFAPVLVSAQTAASPFGTTADYLRRQMRYDSMTMNRMMANRRKNSHSVKRKKIVRKSSAKSHRRKNQRRVSLIENTIAPKLKFDFALRNKSIIV